MRRAGWALVLLGAAVPSAPAQVTGPAVVTESGIYGETYRISGRDARRPDQTMRAYVSPTVSWMGLTIGGTLLWSTESRFTAQTLNRFYLNPRWAWGQIHAGDYVPTLSRFTAGSVRVRGGGFELSPGRLRVAATAGRASEATDLSVFDAAPTRTIYGGLLGYGDPARTFIELSALRAVDGATGADTISAPPQENLVGALAAGIALGPLRLKGEWSSALYSRDTRASELDSIGQPGFTQHLFTPRLSSRLDHAWSAEARLALGRSAIGAQVEQIGPGFTTLGNPYLPNDKREIRAFGQGRFLRGRLTTSVSLGVRRDNLASDKRGTTFRRTGVVGVTVLGGQWSVTSVTVMLNGLTSDPTPTAPGVPDSAVADSFRLKNLARSVSMLQQVRLGTREAAHTISVTYAEQRMDDDSPRFGALLDATSRTVGLEWGLTLAQTYSLSLRPAYQHFRGSGVDDGFASFTVGLGRRAPRAPWSTTLSGSYTQVGEGQQLRFDGMLSYRLGWGVQITAQGRHTRVSGVAAPFNETLGTLRITRRW